mmetsp:Transcript_19769/g.28435  ORF Transcript_19769/g.28435 Transcript_19769/m.28435 type:complete len:295 (-) Transcript_19769:2545-3429(-)
MLSSVGEYSGGGTGRRSSPRFPTLAGVDDCLIFLKKSDDNEFPRSALDCCGTTLASFDSPDGLLIFLRDEDRSSSRSTSSLNFLSSHDSSLIASCSKLSKFDPVLFKLSSSASSLSFCAPTTPPSSLSVLLRVTSSRWSISMRTSSESSNVWASLLGDGTGSDCCCGCPFHVASSTVISNVNLCLSPLTSGCPRTCKFGSTREAHLPAAGGGATPLAEVVHFPSPRAAQAGIRAADTFFPSCICAAPALVAGRSPTECVLALPPELSTVAGLELTLVPTTPIEFSSEEGSEECF